MVAVWSNRSAPLWRGRLEGFSTDQRAGTIYVTLQKWNWGIWLIWWSLVHRLPALIYQISKWKGYIQHHAKWTFQTDYITLKTASCVNSADVWSLGNHLKFNRAICFRLAAAAAADDLTSPSACSCSIWNAFAVLRLAEQTKNVIILLSPPRIKHF